MKLQYVIVGDIKLMWMQEDIGLVVFIFIFILTVIVITTSLVDSPSICSMGLQVLLPSVLEGFDHGRQHLGVHMGQSLDIPQG